MAPCHCKYFRDRSINKFIQALLLTALAGLIVACAELPLLPPTKAAEQAWQARQQTLSAVRQWSLDGRIAIQAEQQGWHAALRWSQNITAYDLKLSSPLGQDVLQLHGDENGVVLRTSEGVERDADAESLLAKHLGWRIPLGGLRYWALGLPDPQVPVSPQDRELDGLGRLTRLRQSGWEIEFRRYTPVAGIDLPDKIFLNNRQTGTQLEVRLVVEKWQIDTDNSHTVLNKP